jgi:putative selenium metabolism hydrolase
MHPLAPSNQQALTDFLRDLLRIPSYSHQEGDLARRMAEEMRQVGFADVRIDRVGNVVGRIGPAEGGPKLLYNGHMDTVGVGDRSAWKRDPFSGDITDGVIYGRGASDMKGALAAMVYAAKTLIDSQAPLAGSLYVVGIAQEEPCEGLAMRVLVEEERLRPDCVVLGEATNLQLSLGQRGRMEMKVTAAGRAAHGSAPQRGINAIYGAARLTLGVEWLARDLPTDPVLGQATMAVTFIENTGGSRNVIPDSCTFYIDRRLVPGETQAGALSAIEALISQEGIDAEVELTEHVSRSWTGYDCRMPEYYPAWLIDREHPLVREAIRAVEQALGYTPRLNTWAFSTDGVYTQGTAGIPTVGFGPGDERFAHTIDDQIRLEDVFKAATVYAQLATDLLRARG